MNEPIIKNIEINNFRRFKNFKGVSQPFNKFNLLYGWNYSGKTTLSNIFEIYSETFDKNVDEDIDFTLITTKGKLCIEDVEKIKTYVFNANYVDKNLFFESNATTNLIVVADKAKEIIEKINDLKNEREVLINDKAQYEKELKQEEKNFSTVRKEYSDKIDKIISSRFNANNIQAIERDLDKTNLNQYVFEDSILNSKIKTIQNPTKYSKQEKISLLQEFDLKLFEELIGKSVQPSEIIKNLSEKKALDWVKSGLEIHQNEDFCLFCNNKISSERLDYLDNAFQSEFDKLGNDITSYKLRVQKCSTIIPSPLQISDNYKLEYEKYHNLLVQQIKIYNSHCDAILKILDAKFNKRNLILKSNIKSNVNEINTIIQHINYIIEQHNNFVDNETEIKLSIEHEIKNSLISSLLLDPRYIRAKKIIEDSNQGITKTTEKISTITNLIAEEEAKISDVKKGADEINHILSQLFLNKSNINLKVIKGRNDNGDIVDVTKLYRGENELATNLSEGEKTAISFAHFYTKILNAINKNTAKDEILFIDDPISSLDKNHIYSISILIKEVIDKFNQTFITTHNFELYRLLDYKKSSTTLKHYYIRRMNEESIITELPEELQKHDTEYDFLFAILYKFKITGEGELFLIGHCLRRFMDNYLQYKIPNNLNPCDKLTKLIKHYKEDQVKYSALYRIANNESHSHPEIIFDKSYLLGAVDLLITFIENYDELHYETLMNCIE